MVCEREGDKGGSWTFVPYRSCSRAGFFCTNVDALHVAVEAHDGPVVGLKAESILNPRYGQATCKKHSGIRAAIRASLTNSSETPHKIGVSRISVGRIVEISVGYLTAIGFLFYPIGMLVFALQLWNAYSYSLSDSLFAVSVVPITAAATRVFDFLLWAFLAMGAAQQIGSLIAWRRQREALVESLEPLPAAEKEQLLDHRDRSDKSFRRMSGISCILLLTAPFALQLILFDSWRTWVLYIVFLVLCCLGGVAAGLVALLLDKEPFISLGGNWRATLVAYGFGILAGIAITGTSVPSLPLVELESATLKEGRLLAHKEGYWYVFNSEGTLKAVSDEEADDVTFHRRADGSRWNYTPPS